MTDVFAYTLIMIIHLSSYSNVSIVIPQNDLWACDKTREQFYQQYRDQIISAYCVNNKIGGLQ